MSSVANKMVQAASGNTGDSPFGNIFQAASGYGRTLDISDINNISTQDSWTVADNAWYEPTGSAIDREKGLVFIVNGSVSPKLTVWDISDPTDVTLLSTNSQNSGSFSAANGIAINTTTQRIYVIGGAVSKLTSYQYSDAGVMTYKSQYYFGTATKAGGIAIDTEDDRLYVVTKRNTNAAGLGSHYEFDISTPDTFTNIGSPATNTFDDTDPIRSTSSTHLSGYENRSEFDIDTKILYGSRADERAVTAIDVSTNGAYSNQTMTLKDVVTSGVYALKAATMDFNDKLYFVVNQTRLSCVDVSDPDNLAVTDTLENLLCATTSSIIHYDLKVDPARKLLFQVSSFNKHNFNGVVSARMNIIDYSDPTDLTLTTFDTPSVVTDASRAADGYRLELF